MTDGIPGENNGARITIRLPNRLCEKLDDAIDSSPYESRSEWVRTEARDLIARTEGMEGTIIPPEDEPARTTYETLVTLANSSGWVREHRALPVIAQATSLPKDAVRAGPIHDLAERGYLHIAGDWTGRQTSYRVRT